MFCTQQYNISSAMMRRIISVRISNLNRNRTNCSSSARLSAEVQDRGQRHCCKKCQPHSYRLIDCFGTRTTFICIPMITLAYFHYMMIMIMGYSLCSCRNTHIHRQDQGKFAVPFARAYYESHNYGTAQQYCCAHCSGPYTGACWIVRRISIQHLLVHCK